MAPRMKGRMLREGQRAILKTLYGERLARGLDSWWLSPDRSTTLQAHALSRRGLALWQRRSGRTWFNITNLGVTVALRGGRQL